jgi:hypothetical protein
LAPRVDDVVVVAAKVVAGAAVVLLFVVAGVLNAVAVPVDADLPGAPFGSSPLLVPSSFSRLSGVDKCFIVVKALNNKII